MKNKIRVFYRSIPGKCSFCFTRAGAHQTPDGFYEVRCPGCGNHTRYMHKKRRQAVQAWNVGENLVHAVR